MANTVTSPNMSMPVPVVSVDPGPDWATNIDACLSIVDSHNHTQGQGVQINPSGIYINGDLAFNDNNGTTFRSVRFYPQSAALALSTDIGCLYEAGADLYYNDAAGNQIRITQSGSVAGSTGTITGLPSGTASASFSGATFTFQSATSTPATMNIGPIITGAAIANPKTVTIGASAVQAANYALVWPLALPASTSLVSIDASGNMATVTTTGSGSVVLATSPTIATPTISSPTITAPTISTPAFTGVPTGTITANTFSPTVTATRSSGGTVTITQNSSHWYHLRIGNIVTVQGFVNFTVSAFTTNATYNWSTTIPIATASLAPAGTIVDTLGGVSSSGSSQVVTNTGTTIVLSDTGSFYTGNYTSLITFNYTYQVS